MTTRLVVFDMDGTLVQTRAASWEIFQETASRYGLPVHSAETFFELFRENFYESLARLCDSPEQEAEVRRHFLDGLRQRYVPGFIPGMRDVVKTLAERYPLGVLSSNAMTAIRRILEAEGVAECFAHVFSGELGTSKEAALLQLLDEPSYGHTRRCSPHYDEGNGHSNFEVVLVTDTVGDVKEARRCNVRAIGVDWGMHSRDALLAAGAETVALWPQELVAILADPADPAAESCSTSPTCSCAEPDGARTCACAIPRPALATAATAGQLRRERRYRAVQTAAPDSRTSHSSQHDQRTDPTLVSAIRRISAARSPSLPAPSGSRRT